MTDWRPDFEKLKLMTRIQKKVVQLTKESITHGYFIRGVLLFIIV